MRKGLSLVVPVVLVAACAMPVDSEAPASSQAAVTIQSVPAWQNIEFVLADGSPAYNRCLRWNTTDTGWFNQAPCDPNDPLQAFSFRPDATIMGNYHQCMSNIASDTTILPMQNCNASDGRQRWTTFTDYSNYQDADGNWQTRVLPTIYNNNGVLGLCPGARGALSACFVAANENFYPTAGVKFIELPRTNLIKNTFSGMRNRCLDSGYKAQGQQIYTWDCFGGAAQSFQWDPWHNGQIRDLNSGMCLDIIGYNGSNGAIVGEWPCNGAPNQSWTYTSDGQIVSNWNSKCLEIAGWGTSNGSPVQMWDCWGGFNQHWDHTQ